MLRALVLLAVFSFSALAQTAQVTGRVTDPAGAVVPGANITITNAETGIRRTVASNEDGYYTIPLLRPGHYSMNLERTGFKPITRSGLQLQVDENARVDFALEIGGTVVRFAQGVTYTATAPDPVALGRDFSKTGKTIYDPATMRKNPSGSGYLRDAFPGNIIPANRIDPVAAQILKYWPTAYETIP